MARRKLQAKYLVEAEGPEVTSEDSPRKLIQDRRQKYLLVNVLARRARELNKGTRPLIEWPAGHSPMNVAQEEVSQEKLRLIRKQTSKVFVSLIKND